MERLDRDGFIVGAAIIGLVGLCTIAACYFLFGVFEAILAASVFAGLGLLFIPLPIVPDLYRVPIALALIGIPVMIVTWW